MRWNKQKQKRVLQLAIVLSVVSLSVFFVLKALNENMTFYYSPSQIAAGEAPTHHSIRVGGLVVNGSVERVEGELDVAFVLTDGVQQVRVEYSGILPDLFREGQGILATGRLVAPSVFKAESVLAKHDENYMPPEVAESMK